MNGKLPFSNFPKNPELPLCAARPRPIGDMNGKLPFGNFLKNPKLPQCTGKAAAA